MQYGDEKKEKLEKLEKKLYSRNSPDIINTKKTDNGTDSGWDQYEKEEVREEWEDLDKNKFDHLASKVSLMAQKKNKFVKKVFVFSLLFFTVASAVAALVIFGGLNSVSSKNVDIKVIGPVSVGSGQEVSLDINVINNNNVALNSASLLVEYPEGTRSSSDLSKALTQERFDLETIKSGKSFSQKIKAVFFGEKDTTKQLQISLEYRVEGSSALFYKDKEAEISISSAPIIITPTYPKEVNSNQPIQFNMEAVSNSKDTISNFLVNVDYPFGFVFSDASPKPAFGNNIWQFSELKPGEKKMISIKGSIIGQNDEEKVFKINAGTASGGDERVIGVPFSSLTESVMLKKSFINLDVFIEGKTRDYVGQGGSQATTEFVITNNLPNRLFNVSIQAQLKGGALNPLGIYPSNGGFFQSSNNTILWDKRSDSGLGEMAPGEQKDFSFRLSPLMYSDIAKGAKPEIEINIIVTGERILDSGSSEQVSVNETRKIVLGTDFSLSAKVVRSVGTIENSGPIPPKVNTPTTYVVVWSVSNSLNQVSNVQVKATMPSYVKWTGTKSPSGESISVNDNTHEIIWNAGSVLPNTGTGSAKKEVSFQLEFLPSTSQIGQIAQLLGEATISGIDKVTGLKIDKKILPVTTNFSGDPDFKSGDDTVVQ